MRELFGGVGIIVGAVLLVFVLMLGLDYSGLMWDSFIGPKRENVRREIFEQTKSYNQGMQQDLIKAMHDYKMTKDPQEKEAIKAMVRHQMADYKESKISDSELNGFLNMCKYE